MPLHSYDCPFDTDGDGLPDYDDPDSDGDDGLPDWWEQQHFGTLTETPSSDFDGDCVTNLLEYLQSSNPSDLPYITSAPIYQIVPTNADVTFSASASPACVNYQWSAGSAPIAGATNSSLTLTAVQLSDSALYRVDAFSGAGTASAAARLVVLDGPAWAIWTNYIAHTNGKSDSLWATSTLPAGWPTNPPLLAWNTNCLLYGKTGFTAISQCNELGGLGAPVTALTRRHGYFRGHGIGPHHFSTNAGYVGKKVWFCTASNQVVEVTIAALFNRNPHVPGGDTNDYTIVIFMSDLPSSITPLSVMSAPGSRGVEFRPCQHLRMSANMPPFDYFNDTSKPPFNEEHTSQNGDSGSPNMIPIVNGSLIFIGGRTTSGPSSQMQADMDVLSMYLNLDTNDYQLNWYSP